MARTKFPDCDQSQHLSLNEGAENWGEALSGIFDLNSGVAELSEVTFNVGADWGTSLFDCVACVLGE